MNIPKRKSEAVNLRRTDNSIFKRKKDKRTNKDLQNFTQNAKDRTTRTPLNTGVELTLNMEGLALPAPNVTTFVFLFNATGII